MFYILHVKNYYSHPFIYLIDSLFVSISSSDIVNIVWRKHPGSTWRGRTAHTFTMQGKTETYFVFEFISSSFTCWWIHNNDKGQFQMDNCIQGYLSIHIDQSFVVFVFMNPLYCESMMLTAAMWRPSARRQGRQDTPAPDNTDNTTSVLTILTPGSSFCLQTRHHSDPKTLYTREGDLCLESPSDNTVVHFYCIEILQSPQRSPGLHTVGHFHG